MSPHWPANPACPHRGAGECDDGDLAVPCRDDAVQKVRRADEARDKSGFRPLVNRAGRRDLFNPPRTHHGNAIRDSERLLLVVRHVQHCNPEQLLQATDLAAHLDPQLGVEVRERLVEQQHVRLDDDRAGDRDALELPAGQLMRPAFAMIRQGVPASAPARPVRGFRR